MSPRNRGSFAPTKDLPTNSQRIVGASHPLHPRLAMFLLPETAFLNLAGIISRAPPKQVPPPPTFIMLPAFFVLVDVFRLYRVLIQRDKFLAYEKGAKIPSFFSLRHKTIQR